MSAKTAWHEAAHGIVALRLGRKVESITIAPTGSGVLRQEPLPPDASDEEIARGLVVVLAGREGERYAPTGARVAAQNGGDPWFSEAEIEALIAEPELEQRPSDEQVVLHYTERIGVAAVEDAKALAAELVQRAAVVGHLERVAEALLQRTTLSGDELGVLLAPTA